MEFFKGFVPTKNKKCIMKFKNAKPSELLTYDGVKDLQEFAGILSEDTILIDVDDRTQSEKLLKLVQGEKLGCRVYETTKGHHFLFKNSVQKSCRGKCALACGLIEIDIKVGVKNSYSVLKFEGKERKVVYDSEEYQEVPKFLLPVGNNKTKFAELKEGDGRNDALFSYILILQNAKYAISEIKEIYRLINDYILPDKLPQDELDTILRPEAFGKVSFMDGNKFLHNDFAKYLITEEHIIKSDGVIRIYDDGVYSADPRKIEKRMLNYIDNMTSRQRQEVMRSLELNLMDETEPSPAHYIAFKNGVFDLRTGELLPFSSDFIVFNKIPYNYNPFAKESEVVDKVFGNIACGDETVLKLLYEAIGYSFYRRNELRKAFILVGDKANGKSTYLWLLNKIIGRENCSNLDLKELSERFKPAQIVGMLANIGDDISDEFIPDASIFKKVVSGDRIVVEEKGQRPFNATPYAKFYFSANNIPRVKDKTGAVIDRLIIIPFNAKFSKDDPDYDPRIKDKLKEESAIEYIILSALKALKEVIKNNSFTESERVQRELRDYERTNDPVICYLEEAEPVVINQTSEKVYMDYRMYCGLNGYTAISKVQFGKRVCKEFDCETASVRVNGKVKRVYKKKGESDEVDGDVG